jgi:hypothetical protein
MVCVPFEVNGSFDPFNVPKLEEVMENPEILDASKKIFKSFCSSISKVKEETMEF